MADADFNVKAIISAQTSQFEKGMKNAQSSVNSLSSSISNITNLVKKAFAFTGVAIGTKAIVDFGKSCVQSANQAVKTFNILDNTVKATGADAWTSIEKLEEASESLSDQTDYSVTEIQKMQSVLLGFTNITGEAFDGASEAVLDMATVMGMDLTSAVQTIGKALDDPITGLDSLRRQGFKFTDEQKAELTQLVKNGKQLEAQNIILDTLATSYGGAAKAGQDSFAKQRHAVENFNDTLGTKLIPVMQVFAENNTKMINSLRKLIENMDFTPVVNVVTNLSKIFAETFNTMSGYLKNVGDYVSDFISRFNFKPIISVLDILIGVLAGVISKFKEINSQKLEVFDKLKEALIDFSNSETFQNIVDFVNKIIDAVFFLWSEVQDISMEIRDLVVNKIVEIWGKIKELFQNSQNALSESGQDIASWGDLFYNILNNTFRIFQDFFGMIKALIHGDWAVAWEYAKLTVMRIADNILDIFSTLANAFPNLINGILKGWNKIIEQVNKARKFFGQDPLDLADMFESVDLSKKSGLEDKIKEAENKIQELTGKSADITIQNLESVSTKFAGFTQHALGEIGKLTEGVATNSEKQKQYFAGIFSNSEKDTESTYTKFSEWDSKLLQQRLEDLDEWSNKYHEIQLALIKEERKKALEADKTGAETEKINAYYNKQIEKENERSEKAKRNKVVETMKVVRSTISNIAKKTVEVFKKVVSTISNAFSAIVNLVKNIGSIFSKLFEFNFDDALNGLLGFEDAVLTFFVETLPKLPAFVKTVLKSINVMLKTLINSVKKENIATVLFDALDSLTEELPDLMQSISTIIQSTTEFMTENLSTLVYDFLTVLGENVPQVINDLLDLLSTTISEAVEGLLKWLDEGGLQIILQMILDMQTKIQDLVLNLLSQIATFLTEHTEDIGAFLADSLTSAFNMLPELIDSLLKIITALIQAIADCFKDKEMIQAMVDGLVGGIEAILDNLGDIVSAVIDLIFSVITAIAPKIPEIILKIIKAIADALPDLVSDIAGALGEGIASIFKSIFSKDFWVDTLKSLRDALASIFNSVFGGIGKLFDITDTTSSGKKKSNAEKGWDIGLGIATGGVYNLGKGIGKLLHWWADGTDNAPAGLSVVGEAGPELVNFKGGEQVFNAQDTKRILSGANGSTNNFTVTFNNLQDTSAYAMINQLKQYNRQMAINGVI